MRPDSTSLGSSPGGGIGSGGMRSGMSRGGSYGRDYTGVQGSGRPGSAGAGGMDLRQIAGNLNDDQKLQLSVYNFVIQFIWVETPPSERDRIKEEKLKAELEKQAANNQAANNTATPLEDENTPLTSDTLPDSTSVVPAIIDEPVTPLDATL